MNFLTKTAASLPKRITFAYRELRNEQGTKRQVKGHNKEDILEHSTRANYVNENDTKMNATKGYLLTKEKMGLRLTWMQRV